MILSCIQWRFIRTLKHRDQLIEGQVSPLGCSLARGYEYTGQRPIAPISCHHQTPTSPTYILAERTNKIDTVTWPDSFSLQILTQFDHFTHPPPAHIAPGSRAPDYGKPSTTKCINFKIKNSQ